MTWISDTTSRLAARSGIDPAALAIDEQDAETLLRLAGVAAHSSGERTNAPLLCHVLGRAVAHGARLDDLARIVDDLAGGDATAGNDRGGDGRSGPERSDGA